MVPTGVRTIWASSGLGMPISGMSCLGSSDSNPGSGGHTHAPWGFVATSINLAAFSGLGSHSLHLGGCAAAAWISWGLPMSVVSSSGVGDFSSQSSIGSSSMASKTSISMNHIRFVMHFWRSLAVPHIIWYGPLDNSVELFPGPGFSPFLFPRCLGGPWGFQVAGICHDVGHRGW